MFDKELYRIIINQLDEIGKTDEIQHLDLETVIITLFSLSRVSAIIGST